jgi:hypothetical protein
MDADGEGLEYEKEGLAMHEVTRILMLIIPLLLVGWLIFSFRGFRMPDMSAHQQRMEQTLSEARSARAEQHRFQDELLGELKRHNAAMEKQVEALTRILERLEKEEAA